MAMANFRTRSHWTAFPIEQRVVIVAYCATYSMSIFSSKKEKKTQKQATITVSESGNFRDLTLNAYE